MVPTSPKERSMPNERLAEARKTAGYSNAKDAAEAFGWTYVTYAAHENGSRGIRSDMAARYGRAFRVAPEWIMFGASGAVGKTAVGVSDEEREFGE